MKLQTIIKSIARRLVLTRAILYCVRIALRITHQSYVLVRVDGGICSQIHFYLIGSYFREKGYKVRYDLSWYRISGKDLTGNFARNFDLLKLSPSLDFETLSSPFLRRVYSKLTSEYDYYQDVDNLCTWRDEVPPVYLNNYYKDFPEMYSVLVPKYFKPDELYLCLDEQNRKMLRQIQAHESVAVHVRRGDLSSYVEAYGNPCSISYFQRAVEVFGKNPVRFYIFSDEPDWCKQNLLPHLPAGFEYILVDLNGSDKGYMDLVLMSACIHTITSKGSLGKYAAMLNNHSGRIVVLNDDAMEYVWKSVFQHTVYLKN